MGPAWLIDHVNGDSHTRAGYQAAAVAGYPAISIPIGKAGGLPVGLCLVGTAWSETLLIRIAFGIEQVLALGDGLRPAWLARVGETLQAEGRPRGRSEPREKSTSPDPSQPLDEPVDKGGLALSELRLASPPASMPHGRPRATTPSCLSAAATPSRSRC